MPHEIFNAGSCVAVLPAVLTPDRHRGSLNCKKHMIDVRAGGAEGRMKWTCSLSLLICTCTVHTLDRVVDRICMYMYICELYFM